jgi:hypothetical protein
MSREDIRRALAPHPATAFRKAPTSVNLADAFRDLGVHIHFDVDDRCEAIELFDPADPTLDGERPIGRPFVELLEWFRSRDSKIETDDAGLTSRRLGVGLYAPAAQKAPEESVEGVIVFRRGYYD